MTEVSAVPRERVGEVWPVVGPMLDKAINRTHGRWHNVDVLTACMDGTASLWVAFDANNEIIGSLILAIQFYPGGAKTARVEYLGGRPPTPGSHERDEWFDPMWEVIVQYCKSMDCDMIEGVTRKGMQSYVMQRYGSKAIGIFFEYDLRNEPKAN
jgi:hypothetical protein